MTRDITRIAICSLLAALALAIVACSSTPTASRQEVLISLTEHVVVPQYTKAAGEMNELSAALHALCANPSYESLTAAQEAWRDARAPWMRSQAMWFGPVMDRRSRSLVDWSPIEPQRIEDALAERDGIDAEHVSEFMASTQRGLGAIEYILFADNAQTLQEFAQPDSIRCQYLTAIGDVAAGELNGVLADWTGAGGETPYANVFNGTAKSSLLELTAVSEVVRKTIFLNRSMADMRLGKALGVDDTEADLSAIPGGAGNNAVADMRNQTLGMQVMYLGADTPEGDGLGVSALMRGISEDSDARVRAAFEDALNAIDGLEEPLHAKITENPAPAMEAHRALKSLNVTLDTEVVSLLGISVGFADTDGDGG